MESSLGSMSSTTHWDTDTKMAQQSWYKIEFYLDPPVDRWHSIPSFSYMRKSFAEGAWAMLKAHYNQTTKHRLLKDGEVIEECSLQRVHVN